VIVQFYVIVCFEEHGDIINLHWMTKSQWYEVSYSHFTRLFGFGRKLSPRVKKAQKLSPSKKSIARFDEKTLMQQWYDDVSFSGFGFDYGGMVGASSSPPPPFDSPPLTNPQNIEESENEDDNVE
jgi:hypothetical protein